MQGCAAVKHNACPNHDTATTIMIPFPERERWYRVPGSLQIKVRRESVSRLNRDSSVKRTVLHCSRFHSSCCLNHAKRALLCAAVSGTHTAGLLSYSTLS